MEYGYAYRETDPDATMEEAYAICEGNVRASLLWDRWRAENAPTAGELRARAMGFMARTNGWPPTPPIGGARWGSD